MFLRPRRSVRLLAVDAIFGPGGRLEQVLPGYEPRAEQAALAAAVETALASGEHLLAEAGTGTGKSLAYLIPALDSGQRVVVSTATKALQEQLLTKDVPIAAAALGREFRVAVLKGRQNYLCRQGLQGFALLGGQLFPREEDAARLRRDARLDRLHRDRRPRRARRRAAGRRLVGDRRRRRPLPRPPLRLLGRVLLRGCARPGGQGGSDRRQPRALLRRPRAAQPHRRARDPARARRRRLRRGAPAGGVGRLMARRPDQRAGDPPAPARRRPGLPRGGRSRAGACARPRRGRSPAAAARGRAGKRSQAAAGGARRAGRDARRTARTSSPTRSREVATRSTPSPIGRCDSRPTLPPVSRRTPTTASSGPSPTCSPGRRSTSAPPLARDALGRRADRDPRLRHASLSRRSPTSASSASGSACARRARSPSARPTTTGRRRSSTCRAAFPTPAPTTPSSAWSRRSRRSAGSRRDARSC